jgi:hypothetical protein
MDWHDRTYGSRQLRDGVDIVAVEVLGRDLFPVSDSLFDVLSRQTECPDPTCALSVNCCKAIEFRWRCMCACADSSGGSYEE